MFSIELTSFEKHALESALKTRGAGKHAIQSSIRHLKRAFELRETMPEVSLFLSITSEEESATAVFHALQKRKYPGSRKLKRRNHVHKLGLHPFLLAIGQVFNETMGDKEPKLEFNSDLQESGKERLRTRITVDVPGAGRKWAYPLPPLHFSVRLNGELHVFTEELENIANEKKAKTAFDYVQRLANRRNLALYASPQGIPHVDNLDKFLDYRKTVVLSHVLTYLLIEPYNEHQNFVSQAVSAYLKLLRLIPDDEIRKHNNRFVCYQFRIRSMGRDAPSGRAPQAQC